MAEVTVLNRDARSTASGAVAESWPRGTKWDETGDLFTSPRPLERTRRDSESDPPRAEEPTAPGATTESNPDKVTRLRNCTPIVPRNIRILQQWEGVVSEVGDNEFTADFKSLTDAEAAPFTGEIALDEVSDADRPLILKGAIFYWVTGYDRSPAGQISRISEIRFRRLPEWTQRKLDEIKGKARTWFRQVLDESK